MARNNIIVGILLDDEKTFHLPAHDMNYDTLCGLDCDDDAIGHNGLCNVPNGQKITCSQCYAIWFHAKSLKINSGSFDVE